MKTIINPFGFVDERAMIEQFYDLHGRDIAERLSNIHKLHFDKKDWTVFAKREGFSQKQIDDFIQLW